jgi:hypothetical protein
VSIERGERYWRLLWGFADTRCLHEAARLRIADRLADGPRPVAELAAEAGVDADALWRVLRRLVALEVFTAQAPGQVGLGPLGELLREDRPTRCGR